MKWIKKVAATPLSNVAKVIDSLDTTNNRTNAPSIRAVNDSLTDIWETIYPVGSIYMSVNNTSPEQIFGGTWEQIKQKYLIGADNENFIADTTGGSFSTNYTPQGTVEDHALTVNEMPIHSHGLSDSDYEYYTTIRGTTALVDAGGTYLVGGTVRLVEETGIAGASDTHNHGFSGIQDTINFTPPYLAVNIWVRRA